MNKNKLKIATGVLADDNRKIVTNFTDSFGYSNKSRVIVELEETVENSKKKL